MTDKIITFKQYQEIGREILKAMEDYFTNSPGLSYDSAWVDNLLVRFTNKINHEIIRKYVGAEAYLSLPEAQDWQPIETAPKDGAQILGYGPFQWEHYDKRMCMGIAVIARVEDDWREDSDPKKGRWMLINANPYSDYMQPTHWMPLPQPPTDKERG